MSTSTTTQFMSYVTSKSSSINTRPKSISKVLKSTVRTSKKAVVTFCLFLTAKIFFGKSNFDFLNISTQNISMSDEEILDELTF
jgi:hypothetical protein